MTRKRTEQAKQYNRDFVHRKRQETKERIKKYKRQHPCIDCGETDITKLEFDHVRGIKRHKLCYMVRAGYTWNTIQKEIDKCEIRCKKCHSLRHYPK